MKSRVKSKTDLSKTGNRPIILKDWEKKMYALMYEESNPSLNRLPGAVSAGVSETKTEAEEAASPPTTSIPTSSAVYQGRPQPITAVRNRKEESDETRHLSLEELQRIVLLEQLEVFKLKKEKLLWEKQMRERTGCELHL
ncbi:hypothetical protein R5R35_009780 [Gryllus longicercus]